MPKNLVSKPITLGGKYLQALRFTSIATTLSHTNAPITRFLWPAWGQSGSCHLGPTGPRWAPFWSHELCNLGEYCDDGHAYKTPFIAHCCAQGWNVILNHSVNFMLKDSKPSLEKNYNNWSNRLNVNSVIAKMVALVCKIDSHCTYA